MSEWISVEDRLPGIHVKILTYGSVYAVDYCTDEGEFWEYCYPHRVNKDVTHWMPLPEPPE